MISLLSGFDSAQTADTVSGQHAAGFCGSGQHEHGYGHESWISASTWETAPPPPPSRSPWTAAFKVDYLLSPLSMMMDGTFSMSAMGQNQDMAMTMYVVANEDGHGRLLRVHGGRRHRRSRLGRTVPADMGMQSGRAHGDAGFSITAADYAEWGLTFELAPEAADVDGTECYLLSYHH